MSDERGTVGKWACHWKHHQVTPKRRPLRGIGKWIFNLSVLFLKFSSWDIDDSLRGVAERFLGLCGFWG